MSRSVLIAVVIWCVTFAASADVVSEHEWLHVAGRAEPSRVAAADLEIGEEALKRFAEAEYPFVHMLERHIIRLKRDGTITTRRILVRRFLTAEGVRSYGDLSVAIRSAIEDLHLDHASVELPDGSTRTMNLRRVQIVKRDSESVFTDVYNVVLPFEGLEPGATAVLTTKTVQHAGRWPLPWSVIFLPQRLLPVQRFEVELTWDAGVEPPKSVTDSEFVECEAGASYLRCSAHDVPALVLDPESHNFIEEFPQLVILNPRTWAELALAEAELVERSIHEAGDLTSLVNRLVTGVESEAEQLHRLHRFVADEIRYVSLSHGRSAVAPAPVARTLDRKYGDCKDKVAAFLALAREAGFRAAPVLVGTSRTTVEKLIAPSLLYFDHMIACVDGNALDERTCIDLTAPSVRTGYLPVNLYGTVALDLIDENAVPRPVEAPPFVWEIDIDATNRLACDGKLTEELHRSFSGPGGAQLRAALSSESPEDRQRWVVENYQVVLGEQNELEASISGLDRPADPLVLETKTEFDLGSIDEIEQYTEPDSWLLHYAGWFGTTNKTRPYQFHGARIRSRSFYELCSGRRVRFTGPVLELNGPFGALRRTYSIQAGGVEVQSELMLPSATIEVEDLDRFRRFLSGALEQTGIWFSVEQSPESRRTQ